MATPPAAAAAPVLEADTRREVAARPVEVPSALPTTAPSVPVPDTAVPVMLEAPPLVAEPERASFEEVVVPADTVIGIRLETSLSSETAQVEDNVTARVTRDVRLDGRTVIPAGARMDGAVTTVQRGGRIRERARVGVRFTSISTIDGVRVPIQTETIYREGDAPGGEATAKIGASAVIGSILGGVIGGKKGAAIGGAAGAAGGTAVVMTGGRNEALMAAGAALTVRLTEAVDLQAGVNDRIR